MEDALIEVATMRRFDCIAPGLIQSLSKGELWPAHDHRQQRRDVVHHRLHPRADRLKASQPQQVERCGSQCGHCPCAITSAAVGVFMELGVSDPVPALNAPAISYQLQQGFWGGAQAGLHREVRLVNHYR